MFDRRVHARHLVRFTTTLFALLSLLPSAAAAQQAPSAQAMQVFASKADITGLIAKAKSDRKPDQANFVQPVVRVSPYAVNLEYRVAGLDAPASVHEMDAELFFVVQGNGTAVTGGKLRDEVRRNAENLTGSAIEGGVSRRVGPGDVLFVPENTPHWFSPSGDPLVLMSMHLPRQAP